MSTSRTSLTPSSTLRPRAARLISGLSDTDENNASPTGLPRTGLTPPSSRHVSPLRASTSARASSLLGDRRADNTTAPRSSSVAVSNGNHGNSNVSFAGLWGTSWSAIQGIANDLMGEQEQTRRPRRRKDSIRTAAGKLSVRPAQPSWGPPSPSSALSANHIATGSKEEREAMVRTRKRMALLSDVSTSYADSSGNYKRRTSDDGISASAPPGANEDRDALVYLHHVSPADTLAGVTIRYGCTANVLRKANRMWPNDAVQARKVLTLPVDACTCKGRRITEHEADLLFEPDVTEVVDADPTTPKVVGAKSHRRTDSTASNLSERPPPSIRSSNADTDPPWTHDSWIMLPNSVKPTEIARLPQRTLGYFPLARRKSQSYSDLDTPNTSLDLPRQSYFDNPSSHLRASSSPLRSDPVQSQRPRRPRRTSNACNGYFPSYLTGPGGVGTLGKDVRSPGPAQDSLNKLFAAKLPNVAPPPNQQNLYLPDIPLYSDTPSRATSPYANGVRAGSGTHTPSAAQGLENVGAAVEGWIRKMASRAHNAMDQNDGSSNSKLGAPRAIGGPSGIGDLIEMADSFEIGGDDEEGGHLEEERGRRNEAVTGHASARYVSGGVRARPKVGKAD